MKLSQYIDCYRDYSARASDVTRNMAFAGIALIWIFRIEAQPAPNQLAPRLPELLLPPLFFLVAALGLDLLQYLLGTTVYWGFHRCHERKREKEKKEGKKIEDDPEMDHSEWLARIVFAPFLAKIACVVLAYWMIGDFILDRWIR